MRADRTLAILTVIIVIALSICVAQYYYTDDDDPNNVEISNGTSKLVITIPDDIIVTMGDEIITTGTYTIGDSMLILHVTSPAEGTVEVTYNSKGYLWPATGTLKQGGFEGSVIDFPIMITDSAISTSVTIQFTPIHVIPTTGITD